MTKKRLKTFGIIISCVAIMIPVATKAFSWGSGLHQTDERLAGRIDGNALDIKHVEADNHTRCNALNEKVDANQKHINDKLDLIVQHVVPHP